jgi:hypothetical protein
VILWEKEISGSCRNYPAQVGILKLESEQREKIEGRAERRAFSFAGWPREGAAKSI